jgi:SAM-dependent methyltransferase
VSAAGEGPAESEPAPPAEAAQASPGPLLPGPKLRGGPPPEQPYQREYEFNVDWFTRRIPVWQQALEPYRGRPGLRYLEVGTFEGRSLFWVLEQILTNASSTAVGIDPYLGKWGASKEEIFRRNLERSGAGDRVKLIKGLSQVELRKLPLQSFDIVYIDGSHAAADVLEDAVLAWRLLKPGGMLIFDDYLWRPGTPLEDRPRKAIDDFHWFFKDRFDVVHSDYQVFLRRR